MTQDLRLTFRDKCDTECYQYKKRKLKEAEWLASDKPRFWDKLNLSLNTTQVKEVDYQLAKKIILEYEWLGDMSITSRYYGIFFEDFCAGVVCINPKASNQYAGAIFGVDFRKVSYFARGACCFWAPAGTASKLISWALKFERAKGQDVAYAYSDPDAGEIGTVYQATNWLCLGKQRASAKPYVSPKGRILHDRTAHQWGKARGMRPSDVKKYLLSKGWEIQNSSRKWIYAYVLSDEKKSAIMSKIQKLIVDYPKRPDRPNALVV
jgi:hypothetical protein